MADSPKDTKDFLREITPLLQNDQYDESIVACSTLIESAEKGATVHPKVIAIAHAIQGSAYFWKSDFHNALENLHKSISLDPQEDFKRKHITCYIASHAKTPRALEVLRNIFVVVSELQSMLIYAPSKNSATVAHYTGLRALKALAQQESHRQPFRLYNAIYMHDREEGDTLLKIVEKMSGHDIRGLLYSRNTENSYSSAYVGSFVREGEKKVERNNGKLSLWRTYGKDQGEDGAGACIHFGAGGFSTEPIWKFGKMDLNATNVQQSCIYSVAYENQTSPGKKLHANLKKLATHLQTVAEHDWRGEKDDIYKITREMLDQVRFLFKAEHYREENELRIVQSHYATGASQPNENNSIKIDIDSFPPRFFVEVKEFPLKKVILGPAVRGFREWEQWLKQQNPNLEVRKSDIPYGERNP